MTAPNKLIEAYNKADKYAQEVYLKAHKINGFAKDMGERRLCIAHVSFRYSFVFYLN